MHFSRTLVLTPYWMPHRIISWMDAVVLWYTAKAEILVSYNEEIRSPSVTMKMPAVIRITTKMAGAKRGIKFSRLNVYIRDGFQCMYCGNKFPINKLNLDHVVPRSAGGKTEWGNIVTSCRPCNTRKGRRSCDESGMFPRKLPVKPNSLPYSPPVIERGLVPEEWEPFLGEVR